MTPRSPKLQDQHRLALLQTSLRLYNWWQRTKLPPGDFVALNRTQIDEVLASTLGKLPPPPKKPGPQRHRRRWRQWSDLPENHRRKLVRRLRRLHRLRGTQAIHPFLRDRFIRCEEGQLSEVQALVHTERAGNSAPRNRYYAYDPLSQRLQKLGLPPRDLKLEGTPTERLQKNRLRYVSDRLNEVTSWRDRGKVAPTFVGGLHPDDVCLDRGESETRLTVAREVLRLRGLAPNTKGPLSTAEKAPLAAALFMSEAEDQIQVFYCAYLAAHRDAPPTVERGYVAKVWLTDTKVWGTTGRFKTASRCLVAGRQLFGVHVAARLGIPEEAR